MSEQRIVNYGRGGFCAVLAFVVLAAVSDYILVKSRNIEQGQPTQYDYVIVHTHPDGSSTAWVSDEEPRFNGVRIYFDPKGMDSEVILIGPMVIMRVPEDSIPTGVPRPSEHKPAWYINDARVLVAED